MTTPNEKKPEIVADDHAKYWPCRYHRKNTECVLVGEEIDCPKTACVFKCIIHDSSVLKVIE